MPGEPTDDAATVLEGGQDSDATEIDQASVPHTGPTSPLAEPAAPALLALIAAGRADSQPAPELSVSLTTAVDAMRDEEIERTRIFVIMGWLICGIAGGTTFLVDAPRAMQIVFIAGMAVGVSVGTYYYFAWRDPARFTERSLVTLCVVCVINGHIGVLFFGVYSAAPMIVVVGIHFFARTELIRLAQRIFLAAVACYAASSLVIITGLIHDPGVFASDRDVSKSSLVAATLFVLGTYVLAYYTARTFRAASLMSIDELQRATRLASQREALMEELRADLERALRVGGPGRFTDQIVGAFKLGIVLGRGAMGEVYEATHAQTGGQAAVKVLRREQLADPTQVARFTREVKATAGIASPNIVRVLDASTAEGSMPYLAMERLHGQTLSELLRREPKLSTAVTLGLCRDAAAGIDALAAAGVVHRDLKPANLFYTADGVWKILDFGVATRGGDTGTLTHGGAVGTPYYMAPEQAQGLKVDTRADIYALAAIAFRCVTGRYPFAGNDTPALLYAVVHRTPPRPSALADVSTDVDRWFAIALAKQPAERFQTAAQAVDALAAAFEQHLDPKWRKRADALVRKSGWESP